MGGGQFQLVSSPNGGQQLIATTGRAGAGGNILTMPHGLIQQAIPLQNLGLGNNVIQNQTQFLANMPVSLNGNITLLPVSAGGAVGEDGSGQQLMQTQAGYFTGSTTTTTQAASYGDELQGSSERHMKDSAVMTHTHTHTR